MAITKEQVNEVVGRMLQFSTVDNLLAIMDELMHVEAYEKNRSYKLTIDRIVEELVEYL